MSGALPDGWPSLRVRVAWSGHEPVEEALLEAGAVSVSLVEAGEGSGDGVIEWTDLDPGWRQVELQALFDDDAAMARARVAAIGAGADPAAIVTTRLAERDWIRAGMGERRARRVGRRLWVCPSGMTPPRPDSVTLFVDPGLAFGTGDHATTALCLDRLSRISLAGNCVLDFGCGSGILAVAALRLGATAAVGVDIDPRALAVSEGNARDNGVADRYRASLPADLGAEESFDVLCANILAGTLIALHSELLARVRPGGRILLSGILADQAAAVRQRYAGDFDLREREREGWVLLYGRRRGRS